MATRKFYAGDIHCASCVNRIEGNLKKLAGVSEVKVNLAEKSISIESHLSDKTLMAELAQLGYPVKAEASDKKTATHTFHLLLIKSLVSIFFAMLLMLADFFDLFPPINNWRFWLSTAAFILLLMIWTGKHFYQHAWLALKKFQTGMDSLIALGTLAAWIYSFIIIVFQNHFHANHVYFETALMIIGLVNLGRALEDRARMRSSKAIQSLLDLAPQTAWRIEQNGEEKEVNLAEIKIDDILRVKPGGKVPVDGKIIEGNSSIDESMLSGEAMPVSKKVGDAVTAGTLNQSGSFLMQVTRTGEQTTLAQIISWVESAQNSRPTLSRLVDRISAYFVPSVLILAMLTALIWYFSGFSSQIILTTALSVLVIACPCALGLATPISIMIGMAQAAKQGILVRNAEAIEEMNKINCIVLDKTGTITEGHPAVVNIQSFSIPEIDLLQLVASIEAYSEHHIAKAILQFAKSKNISLLPIEQFQAHSGAGVSAYIANKKVFLGNEKFLAEQQIFVSQKSHDYVGAEAISYIFVARENQLLGLIGIADPIKADAKLAIEKLNTFGMKILMITGDTSATANAVANAVGISDVVANALPQDKAQIIKTQQEKGFRVAMVGDGINDAPALAQANVGFAIGRGTDVAIETADIVLMQNSLMNLVNSFILAKEILRNIKQNLFAAFIYNILAIPLAAGVFYAWTGWLLNPMIAAAAMALSSLTVVINANRLRKMK